MSLHVDCQPVPLLSMCQSCQRERLLETEEFERAEQERIFKKYDQAPNAAHGMVDLAVGFELHGVCSKLGHRLQIH